MKLDKETVVVILIALLIISGWHIWVQKYNKTVNPTKPLSTKEQNASPSPHNTGKNPATVTEKQAADKGQNVIDKKVTPSPVKITKNLVKQLPIVTLTNNDVDITLNPNRGAIETIRLKKFKKAIKDKKADTVLFDFKAADELALSVSDKNKAAWALLNVTINKKSNDTLDITRVFSYNGQKFSLHQVWTLDKNYQVQYSVSIKNESATTLQLEDLAISVGSIPSLLKMTGDVTRSPRHQIAALLTKSKEFKQVSPNKDFKKFKAGEVGSSIDWLAVSNKFFTSVIIPKEPFTFGSLNKEIQIDKKGEQWIIASKGCYGNKKIKSGEELKLAFTYYAGPKGITPLTNLGHDTSRLLQLTYWPLRFDILEWISRMLLYALNALNGILGSYGWAIITLTIIVKALFWPITQKANISMRRMQKIQPLLQELRDKYKNDPQKMNQETWALYKEHNVNPLGGCLPLLLQMPVFIALFSALNGAIELRQTGFYWITDLSLPDAVGPAIFMGHAFHPLIFVWSGLMLLQQKMTPTADPMQQKMMTFMPIMMLFFLYNMPAGLTLYWTVSQIISLIQLQINRKMADNEDAKEASATA